MAEILSLKNIFSMLVKKYFFPDFSNKLTWFVVGVGATVILTPTPMKHLFYNWIVDTVNANGGVPYTLAEVKSDSAEYWWGLLLILVALAHNILYQHLSLQKGQAMLEKDNSHRDVDRQLFKEFVSLLPSDGNSVKLLRDHDFGYSHHEDDTKKLDVFIHTWNNAEKHFLNDELEEKRKRLLGELHDFVYTLANRSYNVGGGPMYSCIPDNYRGDDIWPQYVSDQIKELNDKSTKCFDLYNDLVITARKELGC